MGDFYVPAVNLLGCNNQAQYTLHDGYLMGFIGYTVSRYTPVDIALSKPSSNHTEREDRCERNPLKPSKRRCERGWKNTYSIGNWMFRVVCCLRATTLWTMWGWCHSKIKKWVRGVEIVKSSAIMGFVTITQMVKCGITTSLHQLKPWVSWKAELVETEEKLEKQTENLHQVQFFLGRNFKVSVFSSHTHGSGIWGAGFPVPWLWKERGLVWCICLPPESSKNTGSYQWQW